MNRILSWVRALYRHFKYYRKDVYVDVKREWVIK